MLTGKSWGEDGGVEGLLNGRVTSSATDEGEALECRTSEQDSQSAHRDSDPSD